MLGKILVPLDGSKLSEAALDPAVELAGAFASELHLLGVSEGSEEKYPRLMQTYLEARAEEARRAVPPGKRLSVRTRVDSGEPAALIIGYAASQKIDLLVIVSHGHSGIMPWAMGGTANKIVHTVAAPVLLLRSAALKKRGPRKSIFSRILLPLDGSAGGEAAVPLVTEIAAALKARVTLFTVIESSQRVHTIGGLDFIRFPEQEVERMQLEMSGYLDCMVRKLNERGVEAGREVRSGHPADEILKFAKPAGVTLTAMSSHGKTGLREWVFGSVSNQVLHAGRTHLLLVRPAASAELTCPR
jgi:nucleotide-binding universal stress UspA family protein